MTSAAPLLLLDTHVWLWFALGDAGRLAAPVRKKIEAASHGGKLAVSAISVWEIGMLDAKGRIVLGSPCEKWVATALALPGLRLIGLEPEIAVASSRLPGERRPGGPHPGSHRQRARCHAGDSGRTFGGIRQGRVYAGTGCEVKMKQTCYLEVSSDFA